MKEKSQEPTKQANVLTSSSSSHKGGLIDKKYEPLEAAIQAYKSRLAAQLDLSNKLKQYPNAREEKTQLEANCQQIWEAQTMIEGPMPIQPKGPRKLKSTLETILEVSSRQERARTESNAELE